MGLFKSGDDYYDLAMESINRKDYDKALSQLDKAIEKNTGKMELARAMICFLHMNGNLNNSSRYKYLADNLRKIPDGSFVVGLTTFDKEQLVKECVAMSACLDARSQAQKDYQSMVAKGQAMIEAAKVMQVNVGQNSLLITEYFTKNVSSGQKIATTLLAEANELLADAVAPSDTKKAAEYQQIAFNFRKQLGESGERNQTLINRYIASCTCWVCGRVAVGEGINFVRMGCDIIPNEEGEDLSKCVDDKNRCIFVCRSCYTALSRRADDISRGYYNESIKRMNEMEARINMRLAAMEAQIGAVAFNSRR